MAVALALDNLAKAQKQGLDEVLVPCAACYARFKLALHEIEKDQGLRREVEETLKHKFTEKLGIVHPLELFATDEMSETDYCGTGRGTFSLKVVCYYGCFLSRVPDHFEDVEYPQSMDRVMQAAGAQVLDWGYRTDCCGGNFSLTRTDIAHKLSHDILEGAKEAGAEAIVVACPFCHMNLDARQGEIEAEVRHQVRSARLLLQPGHRRRLWDTGKRPDAAVCTSSIRKKSWKRQEPMVD